MNFIFANQKSILAITLDQFYHKFEAIRHKVELSNVIIASIKDELSQPIKAGYMLTEGRKIEKIPKDAPIMTWNYFIRLGDRYHWKYRVERAANDPAVILYSGGTTGTTKGILLSNKISTRLALRLLLQTRCFGPVIKCLR